MGQPSDGLGSSNQSAGQHWAAPKSAYHFPANAGVDEADSLGGYFTATARWFRDSKEPVLLLQDTTEFIYQRAASERSGFTKSANSGRTKKGRLRHHTSCDILLYKSLTGATARLPLGLIALTV